MACRGDASCRCQMCRMSMVSLREMDAGGSYGAGGGSGGGAAGGGSLQRYSSASHSGSQQMQPVLVTNSRAALPQSTGDQMLAALEQFGPAPGAQKLMNAERAAAEAAMASDEYVVWRCMPTGQDCTRIGPSSRCFCGHSYKVHGPRGCNGGKSKSCRCQGFTFIPSRPEEVGMWWLPRRKDFDVRKWKAKCKCGHTHVEHDCDRRRGRPCRLCGCGGFTSDFLCVVCDKHWEDHETVWESSRERMAEGRPVGEDFMPLAEAPRIQQAVFNPTPEMMERRQQVAPARSSGFKGGLDMRRRAELQDRREQHARRQQQQQQQQQHRQQQQVMIADRGGAGAAGGSSGGRVSSSSALSQFVRERK